MESFIAAANSDMQAEVKIPEINLQAFDQQAPYVTRRDQTSTACPTPVLKPSTTRTAKITVTDLNFIDVGSLYFTMRLRNNDDAKKLLPLSAIPHCWFRRMTWSLNGCVLEDVAQLSRVEEQISRFVSTNKKMNYGSCEFAQMEPYALVDFGVVGCCGLLHVLQDLLNGLLAGIRGR